MKKILFFSLLLLCTVPIFSQVSQRVLITGISASENTGQDYSTWLTDDVDSLVPNAWENNFKWVDVTLTFLKKSIVNKLKLYDDAGVFTDKPAYLYALNGNERFFLGKFTGETYKTYVDLTLANPIVADAIIVHKYSNNIPQKIQVYGSEYLAGNSQLPQQRLYFESAVPSENTGQDYDQWLDDNLDSLVGWGNANSFKYIDVSLRFATASRLKKISMWDTEGEFTTNPAYLYALKDSQRIFLGAFTGTTYNTWVDIELPEEITADAIVINKYSRYIPQKIFAFGQPLLPDPLDTLIPFNGRIKIDSVLADVNTGMDYSNWLNDDTDSLVGGAWNAINFSYTDVELKFEHKFKVGRISFFDWEGTFNEHPAYIYALQDTGRRLLGMFDGSSYNAFVELNIIDSVNTKSIVIRKYGNDIPQKVQVFGRMVKEADVLQDTTSIVKIPVKAARWFQLNNTSNGLEGLFDSITTTRVETGWGKVLDNYDAYYPVEKGESIRLTSIKFYDGEGSLGAYPMTLSVINTKGVKTPVATFNGDRYNDWVGPYPGRETTTENKFKLDSVITDAAYLVLNCWYGFPTEMELFGHYTGPLLVEDNIVKQAIPLKNHFGVNAFEWDFESPHEPYKIDESRMTVFQSFSGVRHYMDWEKLESQEGSITFSPVHSGGWNYDAIYERCKQDGIEVLACLKTLPGWMQNTYPEDQRDSENVPVRFGKNFSDPQSYMEQAKIAFQYIARYGYNKNVNPSLLHVNSTPRWTNDEINIVKIGMGLIKYIECDNERDKWWKGRKAYQTAFEYAANLSAFYDGHKNTMGAGVGVKNADSTVKVVMGGLAAANTGYLRGMIEWCRINRGYKADSSINLCWDIINYHYYASDVNVSQGGNSTRGVAPEKSKADSVAAAFVEMSNRYAGGMPVWITELGYDLNQGSPLKAIPIGTKSEWQTQADWTLRSALMYARCGIQKTFFYQLYDDNFLNPIQFGSMGLINADKTKRPAADYLQQVNKLLGAYSWKETLSLDPVVDRYDLNGESAFALMIPDEIGRTASYNLHLNLYDSAKVYTPDAGSNSMQLSLVKVVGGVLPVTVTETPVFVIPYALTNPQKNKALRPGKVQQNQKADVKYPSISVNPVIYPNPTAGILKVRVQNNKSGAVNIAVIEAGTGRVLKKYGYTKSSETLVRAIDISEMINGIYIIEINQAGLKYIQKIIKSVY
ncbi:MAG: T9SS type A sorting domain-containing protein [Bacteroidota bacterium]